jgi:APA family basic amino acid/polyamine antiporter
VHLGTAPAWDQLAVAIPVAMVSYTGLETISNMSEEARLPRLMVPRAYRVLVVAVLSIYVLLPAVALSAMPVTHGPDGYSTSLATTYAGDPLLGVVQSLGLGALQTPVSYYVGLLAATILVVAANAGTIGVSRLTYSLGQHRQLPDRLGQISARSRTPVAALLVFAALACLAMVPGQEVFLGNMYAYGAMLSFTTAHVALIGLRWRLAHNRMRRMPGDVEVVNGEGEWYRAPLNVRAGGFDVPVFAVIGALATAGSWVTVMALHHDVLLWGSLWMVVGIGGYAVFRRARGLSLTETTRVERPAGPAPVQVAYASTLIAFDENTFSESARATALKLARHRGGTLRVVVTLEVPHHLPLTVSLDDEEAVAAQIVETARQWAHRGQRVQGSIQKVRPGEAGHRIVAEALDAHAEAVVMPLPRSTPPGRQLSRALEVVLRKRPCRVVIDSDRAVPFKSAAGAADVVAEETEPAKVPVG